MSTSACIYPELIELLQQHAGYVLATVVSTQGSTPQKSGSSALIGTAGLLAGTVGGGMTELKVIQQSQILLKLKESKLFSFELHGEITQGSDSICGGNMTILLDASPELHLAVFTQLENSLKQRHKGILMTLVDTSDPEQVKIFRHWFTNGTDWTFSDELKNTIVPAISEMLQNSIPDPNRIISLKANETGFAGFAYLERILPKPALIIAGAGHIGQSLAHLGKFLGFEVAVWDDRPEYADQTKIPDADIVLSGTVEDSLGQINIREDSYLVIVTRGHKSDAEALRRFIGTSAAYIGMIGSKAKVAQMKASFLENGWATSEQWNRIYTPVGLDIGAKTVEEIAISIASELVKVKNQIAKNHE
jgi:xanthine dehydrogenase accessory factor